jgi:hypothetical protein
MYQYITNGECLLLSDYCPAHATSTMYQSIIVNGECLLLSDDCPAHATKRRHVCISADDFLPLYQGGWGSVEWVEWVELAATRRKTNALHKQGQDKNQIQDQRCRGKLPGAIAPPVFGEHIFWPVGPGWQCHIVDRLAVLAHTKGKLGAVHQEVTTWWQIQVQQSNGKVCDTRQRRVVARCVTQDWLQAHRGTCPRLQQIPE